MQARDDRDEAETEATAGGAAAALDPVEALEHVRALLAGNARSPIRDGDRGPRTIVSHPHLDVARAAVFEGVVEEIRDRVEQKVPITEHRDAAATLEPDATTLL